MNTDELNQFLAEAFSGAPGHNPVQYADGKRCVVRLPYDARSLRPGGTISGPTMMSLADTAVYALVLSAIGKVPLAVTTNLSINFLRKPQPAALIAEARMLKLGRSLAICDVEIKSDGSDDIVAHAVVTYSIPPNRDQP